MFYKIVTEESALYLFETRKNADEMKWDSMKKFSSFEKLYKTAERFESYGIIQLM